MLTCRQTFSGGAWKRPLRRQALGDLQPVDAVHPVEVLGDRAGLVGLDAADEVPGERAGPAAAAILGSASCR